MNETAQHPEKDTLPKAYEFAEVEQRWYARWLADETFSARMDEGKPAFSIVIPPPNVTGSLHIGHALNNTLQDVLIRFERMRGKAGAGRVIQLTATVTSSPQGTPNTPAEIGWIPNQSPSASNQWGSACKACTCDSM